MCLIYSEQSLGKFVSRQPKYHLAIKKLKLSFEFFYNEILKQSRQLSENMTGFTKPLPIPSISQYSHAILVLRQFYEYHR